VAGLSYVLIPGAGGDAGYWAWTVPFLSRDADVLAVDLPAGDDSADLSTYRDCVCDAMADVRGPVVLVAQSLGGFTAPLVAHKRHIDLLVLLNAMVPVPGEPGAQWWQNTGQREASRQHIERIGLGRDTFDMVEDFFHDVPDDIRSEVLSGPEPQQSDTPFAEPWPLDSWPDVPTKFLQGADDRLFPLEFQRRVVRERLGIDMDVMPGGHLLALSRPRELAERLDGYRREARL
jgi:pimeloyl-ACP methyl ester carboxylesterase